MGVPNVRVSKDLKRESVLIDYRKGAFDTFSPDTNTLQESKNVLATGGSTREALAKHYGKKIH